MDLPRAAVTHARKICAVRWTGACTLLDHTNDMKAQVGQGEGVVVAETDAWCRRHWKFG